MKTSRFFIATQKEVPAEAEIVSHRLMLRASMIRRQAAGIYTWLPLGFRVLKKVEKIVREEMACQPCHGYFCEKFPEPECILRVPVDRVVNAIDRILINAN